MISMISIYLYMMYQIYTSIHRYIDKGYTPMGIDEDSSLCRIMSFSHNSTEFLGYGW